MNILLIGSGGREHAIAWRLANSPSVKEIHAVPGNPGIAALGILHSATDYVQLAKHLDVDLTVVGPEAPLVAGTVDLFRHEKMSIVGPLAANARLEGSKIHAKHLMQRLGIPTARFETVTSKLEADAALRRFRYPIVLKTDGLAAGKGVIVAQSQNEAKHAVSVLPCPLLIEEFIVGEEVTFIALCDGASAIGMEPSQDHKRAFDNDAGPNTGGMGAYSDSRILSTAQRAEVMDKIINPIVKATEFTGFLYAGLMMTTEGPYVLEFNVRMGDPETQALMLRLESDWGEALMATAQGNLREEHLRWSPDPATCVVLASRGYPGDYDTGKPIKGIENVTGALIFQAGTRIDDQQLVTAGGRVLGVAARGADLKASIDNAYSALSQIRFDGMHYRTDIGARGLRAYYSETGL